MRSFYSYAEFFQQWRLVFCDCAKTSGRPNSGYSVVYPSFFLFACFSVTCTRYRLESNYPVNSLLVQVAFHKYYLVHCCIGPYKCFTINSSDCGFFPLYIWWYLRPQHHHGVLPACSYPHNRSRLRTSRPTTSHTPFRRPSMWLGQATRF